MHYKIKRCLHCLIWFWNWLDGQLFPLEVLYWEPAILCSHVQCVCSLKQTLHVPFECIGWVYNIYNVQGSLLRGAYYVLRYRVVRGRVCTIWIYIIYITSKVFSCGAENAFCAIVLYVCVLISSMMFPNILRVAGCCSNLCSVCYRFCAKCKK